MLSEIAIKALEELEDIVDSRPKLDSFGDKELVRALDLIRDYRSGEINRISSVTAQVEAEHLTDWIEHNYRQ